MTYPTHSLGHPEAADPATPPSFDPYAPVGSGAPVYGRPPEHRAAADLPVHEPQLGHETEGSPAARPCHMTAGDLFMSLNGFDEIAVATHFGAPIADLRADAVTLGRALVFVHQRRTGLNDRDAYAAAMNLTIQTVSREYFQPEPPKTAEPASAEGNDEPV